MFLKGYILLARWNKSYPTENIAEYVFYKIQIQKM